MDRGTLVEHDGRPAVRFRRRYAHPAGRIWTAISDPEELSHWFTSRVRMEPRAGGTIEFSGDPNMPEFRHAGTVLAYEPPERLAFTWGGGELHLLVEPDGDGCALTLIDVLEARDAAARNAAGWSVCLAELDKHVAGLPAGGPHGSGAESWREHYAQYVAAGLPSGAPVPGEG